MTIKELVITLLNYRSLRQGVQGVHKKTQDIRFFPQEKPSSRNHSFAKTPYELGGLFTQHKIDSV
jgi:hypothetical protein